MATETIITITITMEALITTIIIPHTIKLVTEHPVLWRVHQLLLLRICRQLQELEQVPFEKSLVVWPWNYHCWHQAVLLILQN